MMVKDEPLWISFWGCKLYNFSQKNNMKLLSTFHSIKAWSEEYRILWMYQIWFFSFLNIFHSMKPSLGEFNLRVSQAPQIINCDDWYLMTLKPNNYISLYNLATSYLVVFFQLDWILKEFLLPLLKKTMIIYLVTS